MNFIGIDLETHRDDPSSPTGLNGSLEPYGKNQDRISVFCASQGTKNLVSMVYPSRAAIKLFLDSLDPAQTVLVAHNLIFECGWLCAPRYNLYGDLERFRLLDSMLLLKRWNMMDGLAKFAPRTRYDLKSWVAKFYPKYAGYEQGTDFTEQVSKKLIKYCAMDAAFCSLIAQKCYEKLSTKEQKSSLFEGQVCLEMGVSWVNGLTIDVDYLNSLKELKEAELIDKLSKTGLLAETLNSPSQLASYLYIDRGFTPKVFTPKGKFSTSKKALTFAAREYDDPQLTNILSYRQTRTELKKFIDGAVKAVEYNEGSIIYPAPRVAATYTGRGSYSSKSYKKAHAGIALHQMPRDKAIRKIISVPDGYIMVGCDFASQEVRMLAALQQDSFLIELFTKGLDFHSMTASNLVNVSYDDFIKQLATGDEKLSGLRFTAKVVGLSSLYRISATTMRDAIEVQYGLVLTLEEAIKSKDTFLDTYQGIPAYWERAIDKAWRKGYAETISGRRVKTDDLTNYGQQQTAINLPVQGSSADMKILAINTISPVLARMNGALYFELHDCLYMLIPDNSSAKDNAKELSHMLSNLDYKGAYNWEPPLQFPTDCAAGYSFGDLKKL